VADFMGRKPLPKGERREVISISLKPKTIKAIDDLRGDTTRSRWIEELVGHIEAISEGLKPTGSVYCPNCYKWQKRDLEIGDWSQCHNYRCSLTRTTELKVMREPPTDSRGYANE